MIRQVFAEDVKAGDKMWDFHSQQFCGVVSNTEVSSVYQVIELEDDYDRIGSITVEIGHKVLVHHDECWEVAMANGVGDIRHTITGFSNQMEADEYITNLQDTFPSFCSTGDLFSYRTVSPEHFMKFAQGEEEDILAQHGAGGR